MILLVFIYVFLCLKEIRGTAGGKRHEERNCMGTDGHPDMGPSNHSDNMLKDMQIIVKMCLVSCTW